MRPVLIPSVSHMTKPSTAPLITFIIPVRHQDNARDWALLKENLSQTIASVANQSNSDWQALIVANHGADLPALPERFRVTYVDFSPNVLHELNHSPSREDFLDAFRLDKGRRVLAGMLDAKDSRYFMIVDDDDFVHRGVVDFVAGQAGANGWVIDHGYIWDHNGTIIMEHDDFNHVCGTCLIIRSDLYQLPEDFRTASQEWIKSRLGSHHRITEILADAGTPLSTLPFRGAIYRVAHGGSHSKTPSLLKKYFLSLYAIRHPIRTFRNLFKVHRIKPSIRNSFFG